MAKIRVFNMVSLDGYFVGKGDDITWHKVDEPFNEFAIELLDQVDTIVFGRVTFDLFESYWPETLKDPKALPNEHIIAQSIEDAHKVVFSRSRTKSDWQNSEFYNDCTAEAVAKIKAKAKKDIVVYGSGQIVAELTKQGLVDEYNIMVNPVILGEGRSQFVGVGKHDLKLVRSKIFETVGNVLLTYQPA